MDCIETKEYICLQAEDLKFAQLALLGPELNLETLTVPTSGDTRVEVGNIARYSQGQDVLGIYFFHPLIDFTIDRAAGESSIVCWGAKKDCHDIVKQCVTSWNWKSIKPTKNFYNTAEECWALEKQTAKLWRDVAKIAGINEVMYRHAARYASFCKIYKGQHIEPIDAIKIVQQ